MKLKTLGAEFILTAIFLPCLAVVFVWIIDLQKADAIQETKLDQIKSLLEEVRTDVKTLKEK
jgi:hypothetical protein